MPVFTNAHAQGSTEGSSMKSEEMEAVVRRNQRAMKQNEDFYSRHDSITHEFLTHSISNLRENACTVS